MKRAMQWARASVVVLAFTGACSDEPSTKRKALGLSSGCSINSDCESPLVCAFRRCHAACEESRDCDLGQRCVRDEDGNGICQLEDDAACEDSRDCRGEQQCGVDGQCREPCGDDQDCLAAQQCSYGVCADEHELTESGELPVLPGREPTSGSAGANSGGAPNSSSSGGNPASGATGGSNGGTPGAGAAPAGGAPGSGGAGGAATGGGGTGAVSSAGGASGSGGIAGSPTGGSNATGGTGGNAGSPTGGGGNATGGASGGTPSGGGGGTASGGTSVDAGVDAAAADASPRDSGTDASVVCPAGFESCGSDPSACETRITDIFNCGACGNRCDGTNGVALCRNAACRIVCNAGFDDCDGDLTNGCERDVSADQNNCGACGRSCGGASCSSGQCERETLWLNSAAGDGSNIDNATANDDFVFVYRSPGALYDANVRAVAKLGGGAIDLWTGSRGNSSMWSIVADPTAAYWGVSGNPHGVMTAPADGSGAAVLLFTSTVAPLSLALDSDTLYWSDGTSIVSRPKSGGSEASLVGGETSVAALAIDASNLYFVASSGGNTVVRAVAKTGGTAQTLAIVAPKTGLTGDGTFAYWADAATDPNGGLVRYPLPAGPSQPLAAFDEPAGLVLTNGRLYTAMSAGSAQGPGQLFSIPSAGGAAPEPLGLCGVNLAGVDADAAYCYDEFGVYRTPF